MKKGSFLIAPSVLSPRLSSLREVLKSKGVSPRETLISFIKIYDSDFFRFSVEVDNHFFEMASEIDMVGVSVDSAGFIENVIHPSAKEIHITLSKFISPGMCVSNVLWISDQLIQVFLEEEF